MSRRYIDFVPKGGRARAGAAPKMAAPRSMGAPKTTAPRRASTTLTVMGASSAVSVFDELVPSGELLNDPVERPISEFADLEVLAREIEDVTRGGAVIEEETQFVTTEAAFSLQQPRLGMVEDYQPKFINTAVEKRPLSAAAVEAQIVKPKAKARPAQPVQPVQSVESAARVKTAKMGAPRRGTKVGMDVMRPVRKPARVVAQPRQMTPQPAQMVQPIQPAAQPARTVVRPTQTAPQPMHTAVQSAQTASQSIQPMGVPMAPLQRPAAPVRIPRAQFINQDKVAKRPLSAAGMLGESYDSGVASMAPGATGINGINGTKAATLVDETEGQPQHERKKGKVGMVLAAIITIILGVVAGTVAFLLLPR